MIRIAVTDREFDKAPRFFTEETPPGVQYLRAPTPERELADFIGDHNARHVILGIETYSGPLYEALAPGAAIVRFGVGHDGVDKRLATQHGLIAANTPGTLDESVAEHAIALILAAARRLPDLDRRARTTPWPVESLTELHKRTLVIVGCGHIGRRVGRIAAQGFRMRVVGCVHSPRDNAILETDYSFAELTTDYTAAAAQADFLSIHIPSTPDTAGFINAETLAAIPGHAWLINTARGAVVDENTLYDALAARRIAGAALDVFQTEPYTPALVGKDLRTLDNVIMTPHASSSTQQAIHRVAESSLATILAIENGQTQDVSILNPEVLDDK